MADKAILVEAMTSGLAVLWLTVRAYAIDDLRPRAEEWGVLALLVAGGPLTKVKF